MSAVDERVSLELPTFDRFKAVLGSIWQDLRCHCQDSSMGSVQEVGITAGRAENGHVHSAIFNPKLTLDSIVLLLEFYMSFPSSKQGSSDPRISHEAQYYSKTFEGEPCSHIQPRVKSRRSEYQKGALNHCGVIAQREHAAMSRTSNNLQTCPGLQSHVSNGACPVDGVEWKY